MISKSQSNKLKSVLKKGYVKKVLFELESKNVLNTEGNPYKESMIYHVVNGIRAHEEIEKAIFKVYQDYKRLSLQNEKRKESVLAA